MHRLIPTCFIIMVFSAFLVAQITFDKLNIGATLSRQEDQLTTLYHNNLRLLKDMAFDGTEIDLSRIKAPIVILNFWASWCIPCLEEFPSLVELRKRYPENQVYILGINSDSEDMEKNVKKIYQKYKLNFPSILDKNGWTEKFKINTIPVSIIYMGDEVIISEVAKDFTDKKFLKKIESVLKKSKT